MDLGSISNRPIQILECGELAAVTSEVGLDGFNSDAPLDPEWVVPRALRHEVVVEAETDAKLEAVLDAIFLGSPTAIAMTKRSFLGANDLLLDERQVSMLAHEGWTQRASPEGREGTTAFREKRKPSWYRPDHFNV